MQINFTQFRQFHLLQLLQQFSTKTLPLDLVINQYFRTHKALGSNDRAYIAETVYGLIRSLAIVDYHCNTPISWEERLQKYQSLNLEQRQEDPSIPLHIRLNFPKSLFDLIVNSHGVEQAIAICQASNVPAPTTVRINPLKTTRDALMQTWSNLYSISKTSRSEYGIVFHKKINFFQLPEFKAGFFEVQDEGSQLISTLIKAQPKQHVLDYCSGSGGKTLAFAHGLGGTGQIYLHDIRPTVLIEAKKRLNRAGIQNVQMIASRDPRLKKLKKKMDWILVDAPCSGTGTLRRNPDMKWKFSEEMLHRLIREQRIIFEQALSYLKPEGHIVYATCSILKQENEEQMLHFMKTYQLEMVESPFASLPAIGEMDGFFAVVLKRS